MTFEIASLKQNKFFNIYLFCFFTLLTFLFYSQSLNNFFVLDDFIRLKAISHGAFSENFHFSPFHLLVYRIIYYFFGFNPVPVRILNIIINSLICVLVYKLSFKLFENFDIESNDKIKFWKSFLCSLLFAVHYIHVETVIYFSELHELLYTLFYVLGLIAYLKYSEDKKFSNLIFIIIFYLLCLLSKETAVSFLLCLFFGEILLYKHKITDFFKQFYSLILITAAFILIRYLAFSNLDKLEYSFNIFTIISEILKNVIFTFTAFLTSLDFTYIKDIYKGNNSNLVESFKMILNVYPAVLIYVFISCIFYIIIIIKRDKIIYLSFAFIFITISSFAWLAGYERYLYLPSIGFCIMIVHFFFKVTKIKKYAKNTAIILLIIFIVYNIYNLKQKKANWDIASQISFKTVSQIVNLTKDLPAGSEVYFKNLPGDYKGAWILRDGIHEIPELFVKRNDIKFYYEYEMPDEKKSDKMIYIYTYPGDILTKQ